MIRFHESQRFHGAIFSVLLASLVLVAIVTALAIVAAPPSEAWIVSVGPLLVLFVTLLVTLSHLDVEVTDSEVVIAFRYIWPARRIALNDIAGLSVRRYRPLIEYGGWGVRLGFAGWGYFTGGTEGVQLRLRKGLPVLIGSARPRELEAAIRAGMESAR